jgi:ABC-type antimicrobial peptide transport system permease subunit
LFYASYLWSELARRRARTIVTLLGFAVGVALVVVITSLSRGLDHSQKTALNPLSSIGSDLTVTLAPQQGTGGVGAGGPGAVGGGGVVQANSSVLTDLSKLGKPGQHFVHDFFLPGTQLTFPAGQSKQISALPGVAAASAGLLLSAVHQAGVVPKIVAQLKTGGQVLNVRQRITPPTPAEFQQIQSCLAKAGVHPTFGVEPQGGGGLGAQPRRAGVFSSAAARRCLPARFRQLVARIRTPEQVARQVISPPQTNIKSSTYSIAGVDPSQPNIGLVTRSLISHGRFLSPISRDEALVGDAYAVHAGLRVGSKLNLNGHSFAVVGIARPPLGGQTADVYIPLSKLQHLAHQSRLVNVVLVRASSGHGVGSVQREIEQRFPNAQVASAKQVADQISGSLVDASDLSHSLDVALTILAAFAAFLLAALLTMSSVGKRVRELGTLKAIGWTQRLVVRQVVGEATAQGLVGGLIGIGAGALASAVIAGFGPTLTASSSSGGGSGPFAALARTTTAHVPLTAPVTAGALLLGFGLALAGGLLAGGAGALRAARLRPADAMRTVE